MIAKHLPEGYKRITQPSNLQIENLWGDLYPFWEIPD